MKAIELDEEVLKRLFDAGVPLETIAQHFGCSRPPVSRFIRERGWVRKRPGPYRGRPHPRRIDFDEDHVRWLFANGMPLERMAAHFGCGRTAVTTCITRLGLTREPPPRGLRREASPHWRGGRRITSSGYVRILVGRDYPGADAEGHIFEHRLVMQITLGRTLRSNEVVHHINGNKTDNRILNLAVMTRVAHSEYHQALSRLARLSRDDLHEATAACRGAG